MDMVAGEENPAPSIPLDSTLYNRVVQYFERGDVNRPIGTYGKLNNSYHWTFRGRRYKIRYLFLPMKKGDEVIELKVLFPVDNNPGLVYALDKWFFCDSDSLINNNEVVCGEVPEDFGVLPHNHKKLDPNPMKGIRSNDYYLSKGYNPGTFNSTRRER